MSEDKHESDPEPRHEMEGGDDGKLDTDSDDLGFNPNWLPQFPHPFYVLETGEGIVEAPRTLVELRMCALSASLRSKPEWWRKITDDTIVARWKAEALAQGLREPDVDYVLAELRDYAALRDETTGIEVSCFDKIWQSDSLIPADVLAVLKDGVRALEDVPDAQKDWHPRSNGLVLDLVHPSLYPLVYGRTLVHQHGDDGESKLVPAEPPSLDDGVTSARFAWLPTDFAVAQDGAVTRKGYINNLHPSHTALHAALDGIVAAFIPLFERVLTDLHPYNFRLFRPRTDERYEYGEAPGKPDSPRWDDRAAVAEWEVRRAQWERSRPLTLPAPLAYVAGKGAAGRRKTKYSLRGRTAQVIVKLANIILTPEKPEYPGGSWHVEGMKNEQIVVSGIYYYDEDNITESRLAFRTAVREPEGYEQDDNDGVRQVWGLERNGPLVQDLGSVHTKSGRCIAFPNIYQHRVSPFALADRTRPGHRKIVALFLVDPNKSIPSTSVVAPQQVDWMFDALRDAPPDSHLQKLPTELLKMVADVGGHTMSREEAFAYREELMDERTRFVGENNEAFFGARFNMCEH